MMMKEHPTLPSREVVVYDFIHNTESLETYALCWVESNQVWMTVPVYCLEPIVQKTILNE